MLYKLRYITVVVFGALVFLTLIAGMYFKYLTINYTVNTTELEHAKQTANLYVKFIWNRYYPVVGLLAEKNTNERLSYPQYLSLAKETEGFFNLSNITRAVIYTSGSEFITTTPKNFREKIGILKRLLGSADEHTALKLAKQGRASGIIMSRVKFKTSEGNTHRALLKVYIPISVTAHNVKKYELAKLANAVLEIDYDVSTKLRAIEFIQFIVTMMIIFAFAAITLVIFLISRKLEDSIARQEEEIHDLSTAQAQIRSESRDKTKFLEKVAKEFRTPLNGIISFSEVIHSESMGPLYNNQYKEFARDIHSSGMHLLNLVNDVLDYSRAGEKTLKLYLEEVNIAKTALVCARTMKQYIEASEIRLIQDISKERIFIKADYARLKQVIVNLLMKSLQFTPKGGTISIKVEQNMHNNTAIVSLKDTGQGMSEEDLNTVNTNFNVREDMESKFNLPLNKKLIELMHGDLYIESEEGKGSKITIVFPLTLLSV